MLTRSLCLWPMLGLLATSGVAQQQLSPLAARSFLPAATAASAIAFGDLDGDWIVDVVLGQASGPAELLFGLGPGTFRGGGMLPRDAHTLAVALVDVDGDNDLDLLLGNAPQGPHNGQNFLFLNDGSGSFTDATATHLPIDTDATSALALGDVDGDNDVDLLIGNGDDSGSTAQQNKIYLNDGSGRFTDATAGRLPSFADLTSSVALADVDGDDDLDAVVGNGGFWSEATEQDRLYLNDGSGNFTDVTATALSAASNSTTALATADVDDDDDVDLIFARGGVNQGAQNQLYLNNGAGSFTPAPGSSMPGALDRTTDVAAIDINGDSRVDLVFGNYTERNRVYFGFGPAFFLDATNLPDEAQLTCALGVADLDNNFLPDIIEVVPRRSVLFLNTGFGKFYDTRTGYRMPSGNRRTEAAEFFDADGDGDADLVAVGDSPGSVPIELFLNDSRGSFDKALSTLILPGPNDRPACVDTGDINGDQSPDVIVGNADVNRLYVNLGGVFRDVSNHLPNHNEDTRAVEFVDVDGDQDLDIVLVSRLAPNQSQIRLYRNDGTGRFTDSPGSTPLIAMDTNALTLGDIDGDMDPDLVLANGAQGTGQKNLIYLNDSNGSFSPSANTLPHTETTTGVILTDMDGDNDLDIVFTNGEPGGNTEPARLHFNDSLGVFRDATSQMLPPALDTASVLAEDFDEDGDVDLLFASFNGPLRFYLNIGFLWTPAPTRVPSLPGGPVLAAADIDFDRDLDVLHAEFDHELLVNRHRQVHIPFLARSGFPFTIEITSQPTYGRGTQLAVPFLGVLEAPIPLQVASYGLLRLQPGTYFQLPVYFLAPRVGPSQVVFTIPNLLPPLAGQTLYTQAFIAGGIDPFQWRMSNYTASLVVR